MAKKYIESEAAVKLFQNAQFEYTAEEAAKFVSCIPITDVRPVVRGRWEKVDRCGTSVTFRCSECNYYAHTNTLNFCPNCGADMRKELSHA